MTPDGFRMSPKGDCKPLTVPCGQCVGCRLERSRQWAVRCTHEASLYSQNCFITLTYSPEYLPADRSLHYDDFQKFMKRLRFSYKGIDIVNGLRPIRFYMCGEYGEKLGRPHFHACIFNFDFPDKKLWMTTDSKSKIYRSAKLEELWPYGFSSIGEVNFQSAAYVARYIMKKINGKNADAHYEYVDTSTGEVFQRTPEFTKMSLKPGIAAGWFEKYSSDVYKFDSDGSCVKDSVTINNRKIKPPRYYDKLLKKSDSTDWIHPITGEVVTISPQLEAVKFFRDDFIKNVLDDNTDARLAVKEQVTLAKLKLLKRNLT